MTLYYHVKSLIVAVLRGPSQMECVETTRQSKQGQKSEPSQGGFCSEATPTQDGSTASLTLAAQR